MRPPGDPRVIYVHQTDQGKNRRICDAFAAGCGGQIVPPYPLQPDGAMFCFGILRGTLPTLLRAQAEGREWYYADNGYFRPERSDGKARGYYRITRNAWQHDGTGTASPRRWERLDLAIRPWRKSGDHIVICPPARLFAVAYCMDADVWLKGTLATLARHTDRPLRVRRKMSYKEAIDRSGVPLGEDLKGAWALVTHSSNAAVEALLAGVPVFCTAPCAGYRVGRSDLAQIEAPALPDDRDQWAWNLAAAQWRTDEMRDGTCWGDLQGA